MQLQEVLALPELILQILLALRVQQVLLLEILLSPATTVQQVLTIQAQQPLLQAQRLHLQALGDTLVLLVLPVLTLQLGLVLLPRVLQELTL